MKQLVTVCSKITYHFRKASRNFSRHRSNNNEIYRFLAEKEGLPLPYKNLLNVMEMQESVACYWAFRVFGKAYLQCFRRYCVRHAASREAGKNFFRVNAPTCRNGSNRFEPLSI
ncbi:hypothetical protein EVAR_67335_1 [Eumeta japonica]|uniref:Uncharacterized protein n=1 Tax=Eumeta variegata TaxID=151549 RepID=A0A4C2A5S7_EUMVA|nr:hypothetical protein EVAR_67335_1 [Eumeta japonica]